MVEKGSTSLIVGASTPGSKCDRVFYFYAIISSTATSIIFVLVFSRVGGRFYEAGVSNSERLCL